MAVFESFHTMLTIPSVIYPHNRSTRRDCVMVLLIEVPSAKLVNEEPSNKKTLSCGSIVSNPSIQIFVPTDTRVHSPIERSLSIESFLLILFNRLSLLLIISFLIEDNSPFKNPKSKLALCIIIFFLLFISKSHALSPEYEKELYIGCYTNSKAYIGADGAKIYCQCTVDKLSDNLKPLGLVSVSRTGAVAMTKGPEIFGKN